MRPRAVVVGGGIAGVSIAHELAARADVVLVEREPHLAFHTTGRSAAMYLGSYGNGVVRALTAASREDFARIGVDAGTRLLTPRPLLWIAAPEDEALDQLLVDGAEVELLSADQARAMSPVLRTDRVHAAAVDHSGMDIDVASFHQAYVRGLRARGGDIRRSTPVEALTRGADGWIVRAGGERFDADIVVNAAGAWADELATQAGTRRVGLQPLRRTLFTSPVPGSPVPPDGPLVADIAERFYFKPEGDHVLVSPADETPSEPCDARPEEADIALALEAVNHFTVLGLRSVRHAWAGLRSFVADRSPVVGAREDEPGFFWFAGQGGYGIQLAPAMARAGASLALDQRLPADIATGGVTAEVLSPDRPAVRGG